MARFLSDEKIASQYEDFNITHFELESKTDWNGKMFWVGVLEIDFPNADHPDFDSSTVDDFIVYDQFGDSIAFDHWYPEKIVDQFIEIIKRKIQDILNAN